MRTKDELTAAIRNGGAAVVVVNTRARRGAALARDASALLRDHGIAVTRVIRVDRPERLGPALEEAIGARPDLLIAAGGDGTLSTAARRVAGQDMALGVISAGTTNNFARSLGLPQRLRPAVAALASGRVVDIDLGETDHDRFANMVSIGVSVQVAGRVPHRLKRHLGRVAYPLTALRALPGHRPFHVRITTADTTSEFETHQLNIANGAFHGGRRIARDAGIDDRLLLAYRLGDGRRWSVITSAVLHSVTGPVRRMRDEPFLVTDELYVETDPVLPLDVDGEIHGQTPTRVRVVPNALRVLAPADFTDS